MAHQMSFSCLRFFFYNNLTSKHKLLAYLHCQFSEIGNITVNNGDDTELKILEIPEYCQSLVVVIKG